MPIGVPLIICGSIALVGSGYAFKKLVYDQHLAHYVEAFIATHLPTSNSNTRLAAPVASYSGNEPSEGSTSAWAKGLNRLRRRGRGRGDYEGDGEPLISLEERQSSHEIQESHHHRQKDSSPNSNDGQEAYHDIEQKEKDEKMDRSDHRHHPTFHTHTPSHDQTHDDEIKSSIFNLPPSSHQALSNDRDLQPPITDPGPSGTFSFLSLGESQVSSPEGTAAMLDSMTFSDLASGHDRLPTETGWQSDTGRERREDMVDRRDEVMSMPDTGYTSEAFSNISSPRSGHRSPSSDIRQGSSEPGDGNERGLGLAVEDLGMSYIPMRRQESVMSLSESEGGSDWERISVTQST